MANYNRQKQLAEDDQRVEEALHIIKRLLSSVIAMDAMSSEDQVFVRRMIAHRFITPTELERLVTIEARYGVKQ